MRLISLTAIMLIFGTQLAFAAASSQRALSKSKHYINGVFGYTAGGFGFAGEYEAPVDKTYSWGGIVKINPKNKNKSQNGINYFAAYVRPHFHRKQWDLYITMAAGMAQISAAAGGSDKTVIAGGFGTGVYYQLNSKVALGAEQMSLYGWLQDDYPGSLSSDMMFKVRFAM